MNRIDIVGEMALLLLSVFELGSESIPQASSFLSESVSAPDLEATSRNGCREERSSRLPREREKCGPC